MKTNFLFVFVLFAISAFSQNADSLAEVREVDSLIQASRDLTAKRDFDKALEVNAVAEKIALENFGKESAEYGNCCQQYGKILARKGDIAEAVKWYQLTLDIRGKALGKVHPDYVISLNDLGLLYWNMGNFREAEPLLQEALNIQEKVLGKDNAGYANSLFNLGVLYGRNGDFKKAEPYLLAARTIQEKTPGKTHPDYARSVNGLGLVYDGMAEYEKAEPFLHESKSIREKMLGKINPEYCGSLINLGNLYRQMQNYEKAEPYYIEAKEIFEVQLKNLYHPFYMNCLGGLGRLYQDLGDHGKAEPIFLEASALREKKFGKGHPDYALSLMDLGFTYFTMGNYKKSWDLFFEAKTILEHAQLKENPEYAASLQGIARFYSASQSPQYENAEELLLEAKTILENSRGKEHPDYLGCLTELGNLYFNMRRYENCEAIYLEILNITAKTKGKAYSHYIRNLSNLGYLYYRMNQFQKAESLLLEAKDMWAKSFGKGNFNYENSLANLTILYWAMSKYKKAGLLLSELVYLNKQLAIRSSKHLSEREQHLFLHKYTKSHLQALSFIQLAKHKKSNILQACYDNCLFYKGFLLNAANQLKRLALSDSTATERFNLLKSYERRLAGEYGKPVAERNNVPNLEAKADSIQKVLARTVTGFTEASRQIDWKEVQAALQIGEAAVEFVDYKFHHPQPTDSVMYAAFVLLPRSKQPVFIPLFEEKQLRPFFSLKNQSENIALTYAARGASPIRQAYLNGLYELVWQPLEKCLRGVKTVYYSPSGLLHRVNFDAIPLKAGKTLSDRVSLVRLNSTRSLVLPQRVKPGSDNTAALFGGIQYETDTASIKNDTAGRETWPAHVKALSFSYADRSLPQRGDNWNYLPGTEKEVTDIGALLEKTRFSSGIYLGKKATEEAFKAVGASDIPSTRILHIATHGFFFPDPNPQSAFRNSQFAEPVFKISDHPMIRSGLILAGANHAWKTGKPLRENMEDGILTAYEISQMNLSNTELVVLSACETGLGDIQGNEGVYGLQRAFKIAGAKYLIMSLWQVPDKQTSLLMTTFYRKWLEEKMTIPEAFRAAQKELREAGLDPYYWAGFVLVE